MNPIVKTQQGEVRGSLANGVHTFKGIPYARHRSAPIGSDRHSRARSRPDRVRAMTAAASPATASSA
ncbi:MAG TPA: hypothetical protein VFP86_08600 [bacterium]|nr:hypothetical protein [bacterium]